MESVGLRRLPLMTRLSITAALALLAMLAITWQNLTALHDQIYSDRQLKTRHLVEVAHGILNHFYAQQKAGRLSEQDAKQQALAVIKSVRYEKAEYFWIQDNARPHPRMVMHPAAPALDGTLMDEPKYSKATSLQAGPDGSPVPLDNVSILLAFSDAVAKTGDGFVEYSWPKPLAGGGITEELYTKLSYVKKFAPWDWTIGSGIYVDDVDQLFHRYLTNSIVFAVLATLALLATAWLIRRSIVREFGGEPAVALAAAGRIGQGDLTQKIELMSGDTSSVLSVLAHMQDSLKEMLQAVIGNARSVSASVQRLSAESNEIELANQLQILAIEQTRTAIAGVSDSVDVISGLAHETEEGSEQVARRAREGAEVASKVAEDMRMIAETVTNSSAEVTRLVASTREIDKMANVIKEIADQTNLLALNAAIEAARAGEQGRGFAVVADEVRKLAERTSKATQEIGAVLQGIQADTVRAVTGMNTAGPVIANGVTQANEAAETLRSIESQSQETLHKMQELAQATRDQTGRIAEIVGSVDDVRNASVQTENVTRQSVQSAADLEAAAAGLFDMVKRFNIGNRDGRY
ncbi:MAG: methyl-accepting chemotaxis protein [Methylococcaceae bacterium]|nr:methyl-accepting chemotaxis protein [Methylococcaceae bacterium]